MSTEEEDEATSRTGTELPEEQTRCALRSRYLAELCKIDDNGFADAAALRAMLERGCDPNQPSVHNESGDQVESPRNSRTTPDEAFAYHEHIVLTPLQLILAKAGKES